MYRPIYKIANASPAKRTFEEALDPLRTTILQYDPSRYAIATPRTNSKLSSSSPYSPSKKRSSSSCTSLNVMLVDCHPIMSGSFPSLMSVFGNEDSDLYRAVHLEDQPKPDQNAFELMTTHNVNTFSQQHAKPYEHRGSLPSLFSDSTESSPTTTNSTFDSPSVSDASASNSPESANSLAPPTTFRSIMLSTEGQSIASLSTDEQTKNTEQSQTMQEATKNVKKLTLDMSLPSLRKSATITGSDPSHPLSAPSSPLKEPMKSARKKPAGLTIRTPGYNQLTFPRTGSIVPSTPSTRPTLHAYQSSPSLSSIASPTGPPAGGMFLPLPPLNTSQSKHSSTSSNGSAYMANTMPDLREEDTQELQKSQEAPERGYTNGPVCIYDCGVYLYLEPTAEEARQFDTIINVAKEITNPFKQHGAAEGTVMSVWRNNAEVTEPQTAVSEHSFRSALEWPLSGSATSPTTPKQSMFAQQSKQPEYIHVRWDHNSEILEDLYPLCSIIDERVAAGKKVLVHCQLGVSRSASLIIAYGLFKGYQQNFHSMYMTVKDRSRWVGPNMSLIYQLTDFKNRIQNGAYASKEVQPDPAWFVRSPEGALTPLAPTSGAIQEPQPFKTSLVPSAGTIFRLQKHPTPLRLNKALPPVPLFPKEELSAQKPHVFNAAGPLPLSAEKSPTTVKRAASRPLPFRARNMDMAIPDHKPKRVPSLTPVQSSAVMDLAMRDVPSTPSLFSPRTTEFMATPFGLQGAGDLAMPGNRASKEIPASLSWLPLRKEGHLRTASKDPRSPHHENESKEIFQNIDNFL